MTDRPRRPARDSAAQEIPIFNYHCVSDNPPPWIAEYTVTPRDFLRHLELVAASGRTVLSVGQLAEVLTGRRPLPYRPLALTFDDGFADFAVTAAPALAQHRFPSTFYVVTGALRGSACRETVLPPHPMVHGAQLPELEQQGVEIGAHSHTHRELDVAPLPIVGFEVARSKEILEYLLGHEVKSFAYPYGFSTAEVRELVRAGGFTSACAVRGLLSRPGDDLFALARLPIRASTTAGRVAAWLTGYGARIAADRPETLGDRAWRTYRRLRGLRTFPERGLPEARTASTVRQCPPRDH